MPAISKEKRDKIAEQVLAHLFSKSPEPQFTAHIGREIARDEEFTKSILTDLLKQNLVIKIKKNNKGIEYIRRERWRLSNEAYGAYQRHQIRL